jgi:hypothetical protein
MGSNTYLSEAFNWLDFLVVVTSLLENLPGMGGVKSLRTFRLFRPLRTLTTMPSMKLLIGTLISSVSQLGGIMGLASFFFAIFAILGTSLLSGMTHYRCYKTETPDENGTWEFDPEQKNICGSDGRECNPGTYCGSKYDIYYRGNPHNWNSTEIGYDT